MQHYDSCVLERIVKHFTTLGVPILKVHDAVICQERYKDFVLDVMKQEYTKYINEIFKSGATYTSTYPHSKYIFRNLNTRPVKIVSSIMSYIHNSIKHLFSNRGKIPQSVSSTIRVKEEEHSTVKCNKTCKHAERAARVNSCKRIFLSKIKMQYVVRDNVAVLDIRQ